ncbi:MAG: SDR family NAD(P)-dependent oxidoreductase [Hyphomicrobiales bacterium]
MQDFRGKTAVITGAGSGIGRGLALRLADEGMNVVVADVEIGAATDVADEIGAAGGTALPTAVDVAKLDQVQAVKAAANDRFGDVHLLINNAGVSIHRRGIYARHEDWQWVLGVNLWGVIHGIETFLPRMLEMDEDTYIVNTASMNGFIPSGHSAMYSASKYGVIGITETLRNELEGTRVGISALCPAGVSTRITESERNRPKDLEVPKDGLPEHKTSSRFEISPPLDPADVADLVVNGIRKNLLYIHTDPLVKPLIERHHARIIGAFDEVEAWRAAHPRA